MSHYRLQGSLYSLQPLKRPHQQQASKLEVNKLFLNNMDIGHINANYVKKYFSGKVSLRRTLRDI